MPTRRSGVSVKFLVAGAALAGVLVAAIFILGWDSLCSFFEPCLEVTLPSFQAATIRVEARQGWQDTGISVTRGAIVTIEYVSGLWTGWGGEVPLHDAAGPLETHPYVCADFLPAAQCVEPVPDFQGGALVGRVGRQLLQIGNSLTFVAEGHGRLELRINDGDVGLYDNEGAITAQVTVQR
jgi:hypothetical protein